MNPSTSNRLENAIESRIFTIPISTLIMYSVQLGNYLSLYRSIHASKCSISFHFLLLFIFVFIARNKEVEFYYLTDFTDPIVVSLNISLHNDIKEVAMMYVKAIQDLSVSCLLILFALCLYLLFLVY